MPRTTSPTTFRFDPPTLKLIDDLAQDRESSKTDLLRAAVELLHDALVVAAADASAALEVIRQQNPGAESLVVDVSMGPDGLPVATPLIDGEERAEVGARAAVIERKAYVFLTITDGSASFVAGVGDDALLIRPQFAISDPVPWPAEGYRIALPLKTPARIGSPAKAKA